MTAQRAYDPKTEELEYVAGDKDPLGDNPEIADMYRSYQMVDPTGATENVGQASSIDAQAGKAKVQVRYDGKHGSYVLETDVFQPAPGVFEVHIHCPKCHKVGRITMERKAIDFDGVTLSIEPWMCTWETQEADGRRMEFGLGLCRARYALDKNRLKDA
jgi:hypothetical protein